MTRVVPAEKFRVFSLPISVNLEEDELKIRYRSSEYVVLSSVGIGSILEIIDFRSFFVRNFDVTY